MKTTNWIVLLLLLSLVVGCSSGPRRGAPAPVIRTAPAEALPDGVRTAPAVESPGYSHRPDRSDTGAVPPVSPAVVALVRGAERNRTRGDLEAAAAALERALRIEPRNALLWHRLALIRFDQRDYRAAISLATRSSSLARGDRSLREANRKLIERARSMTKRG